MFTFPAAHFGDEHRLTPTNFPSLLHAFVRAGIGATTLVDHRNEVTLNCASGFVADDPAPGNFYNNGAVTVSGAFRAIGTKHALFITVGNITGTTQITRLGNALTTGPGIAVRDDASVWFRRDSTNSVLGAILGGSPSFPLTAMALLLDQTPANGAGYLFGRNSTTSYGPSTGTVTGDVSASWAAFANEAQMTFDNYTGLFLFAMDWLPSNTFIADALTWMGPRPGKVYPGFYGR